MNLNDTMEFDSVILVNADGTVTGKSKGMSFPQYPELRYGELQGDPRWTLLSGFSGQYRYSGPIMHPSEFIGGGLAEHILSTPGYWVSLVSYVDCDEEGCDPEAGCDHDIDGWAVAHMDAS